MATDDKKYVLEITPMGCYAPFAQWGEHTTNYDILWSDDVAKVALVVFTGGTDVDPALYGEKRGRYTGHPDTYRDRHEQDVFDRAKAVGIPMVGICRGAQLLCVKAGGRLIQDVTGHGRYHAIRTHDGQLIECNSTHHQMQLPPEGAKVLAVAEPAISAHYLDGDDRHVAVPNEVEVAYYQNVRAVAIQYHPEWLSHDHPCVEYAQQVVREFLFPVNG